MVVLRIPRVSGLEMWFDKFSRGGTDLESVLD